MSNGDVITVMRSVAAPQPVLSREREAALSERHREILAHLSDLFQSGFAELSMAQLAAHVNCSLRTLYQLAEGRNELVVLVIDRVLRGHGKAAMAAVEPEMAALDAIGVYLHAANRAVADFPQAFADDVAKIDIAVALHELHSAYICDVTEALLDLAIERGELSPIDTAALSRMLGGLGRDFTRPEVLSRLSTSPEVAANVMLDLVLAGLPAPA